MEKFEYKGNVYYFSNGKFFDEYFIELSQADKNEVSKFYYSQTDIKTLSENKVCELIKSMKDSGSYFDAINTINFAIEKFDNTTLIKNILPVLTSCYRSIGKPLEAIAVAKKYVAICPCGSSALFTSVAAAFCDVSDYEKAKKFANRAYAMSGPNNSSPELMSVYSRIKAESKS